MPILHQVSNYCLLGAFETVKGSALIAILYVHVVVHCKVTDVMVHTSATHNFVSNVAAVRLKLDVGKPPAT